jgi:hypothetical protein
LEGQNFSGKDGDHMLKQYSHFVDSLFCCWFLLGKLLILAQKCVKTGLEDTQMRRAKGWSSTKTSHKESCLKIWVARLPSGNKLYEGSFCQKEEQ